MTVLTFPWQRPPLSANDRMHWATKARATRAIRDLTAIDARKAGIPAVEHVTARLAWVVTDRRRRDTDNTYPTFKAMCDGLVDAGIVPDDTPEFMTKLAPVIVYEPGGKARVELEVTT